MSKSATMALFAAGLISTGAIASIGLQAFAQTPNATTAQSSHQAWFGGDDDNIALPEGGISETQATDAVTATYPTLTIKHIHLENENGGIVYSAKLSDGTEVIVDAITGAVSLETEEQEATEHQNRGLGHKGHDEANDVEVNDGPDGPTDAGE